MLFCKSRGRGHENSGPTIVRTHIPAPPLSDFVAAFWLSEGESPSRSKERLLPTGTVELIFDLDGDAPLSVFDLQSREIELGPSMVTGPHSRFFGIDPTATPTIGVHFRHGGAFPFLGPPVGELRNKHLPMEALWGGAAGELRDRLLEARTPEERFRLLEHCLLAQLSRPLARHPAVAHALREFLSVPQGRMIADVTREAGLSSRRFIEVFSNEVGLTPKLFCRIQRFQEVLRSIGNGKRIEWADLALACGYFDQAHLNHDFKAFSGLNPTTYLAHHGRNLNHVPL